jgi:hypothetical protein
MNLAAASAVLAQTSQSANAASGGAAASQVSYTPLINKLRRLQDYSSASQYSDFDEQNIQFFGETLISGRDATMLSRRNSMFAGILHNLQVLQENMECDPSLEGDADIGILSCGAGRYCAESAESPTGGICLTNEANGEFGDRRRGLQRDETIIDELQYACDYAYLIEYECTCNLDAATYSGTAVCTTPSVCTTYPSACNVNTTDCRSDTYSVNVKSVGSWDTELCIEFTAPYQQKTCYSLTMVDFGQDVASECSINFQGEACSSCQAYAMFDPNEQGGNITYPSQICYLFDCTNTASGLSGNTCTFPVSSMSLYLDTYGCPPCNLCGVNGTMMSPETSVRVLNNTYQCGYIQDVSSMGFFTEASCQYFSSAVETACQCDSGMETEAPTDISSNSTAIPTENTTLAPTDANATQIPLQICEPCPGAELVNPDGLVSVPGQTGQISCKELASAGAAGSIPSAVCPTVRNLAAIPCCGEEEDTSEPEDDFLGEVCNPCGPNKEMTKMDGVVSVPSEGMFSCQELAIMGRVAEEDEDWCVLIQPFVQTPCGCRSTVPTAAPTMEPPIAGFVPANLEDSASRTLSGCLFATVLSGLLLSLLF